ncbi:MAG: hypothetical protein HKN08_07690 [Gammaproteobacteria bacterium]|nr:hypothetical protein [Gammaproteobacteria bacterium]
MLKIRLPLYKQLIFLCLLFLGLQTFASEHEIVSDTDTVHYPASFFDRYQPNTALDMVRQVPGFELDDGDGTRGMASSGGNLLINSRRPSAKQDLPSAVLARIPASQVETIELIRGQAQGIDFQGQSVLANVYLRMDIPATVRWELWGQHNKSAPFKVGGNVSMSDRWGDFDINVGLDAERDTSGWKGTESEFDGNGMLLEVGPHNSTEKGIRLNSLSFNVSTWMGENFIRFNSRLTVNDTSYFRPNGRVAVAPGGRTTDEIINLDSQNLEYELGADVERAITDNLVGNFIVLYNNDDSDSLSTQDVTDENDVQILFREADTRTISQEQITRLEFDWSRFESHAIQFNAERAYNVLDRDFVQTDDRGPGPVLIDVPGANSKVKEVRYDFLLQDTWSVGIVDLDFGLGAETSRLSQTGDSDLSRDFFFIKPFTVMSYSHVNNSQTRLRFAREVAQLDLDDFVSATVFEDDDFALGNPNIRPETTWVAEVSHEQRFGRETVITVTAFHHWITDVLDLLPLSPDFEAPGNIGDGRRWGITTEGTVPLQGLGLPGAKLDMKLILQDSVVTDPVTGERRRFSGDGGGAPYRTLEVLNNNMSWRYRVDYRQDFEEARVAWGLTYADRSNRPLFKVNELDVHSEGPAGTFFIETTRWFGVKINLLWENLFNFKRNRERTRFTGERDISPVDSIIIRDRQHDRYRIGLHVSGTF